MTQNQAAWAMKPFDALTLAGAPLTPPGPGEVQVRNRAVAINPVDRYKWQTGKMMFGWIRYPAIFGYDLAGEVAAVGPGVTRFVLGDRVLANATGMDKARNRAAEGAFQLYTVVQQQMACKIPDDLSYEAAAVLPLGLSTAACGLFGADQLGLTLPVAQPVDQGKTVLIWGGSSSVGCNAIQLAVAAGYRVVTTAAPANAAMVRRLGAAEVFDHHDAAVVNSVVQALDGVEMAGALALGKGSAAACIEVLARCKGRRHVALATFPLDFDRLPERPGLGAVLTRVVPMVLSGGGGLWLRSRRRGVSISIVMGTALAATDLSRAIYDAFLPAALREGRFVAAPEPLIMGRGLAFVQAGLDRHRQGVSAAKVVVSL
jgi:NADPH:quinone reductase-like Zn-dependent oxidoreductase